MSVLHADRAGVLRIDRRCPDGALPIVIGRRAKLEGLIRLARLAYDNTTWLVPGVPEAGNDDERAMRAVERFAELCEHRLAGKQGWPWTPEQIAQARRDALRGLRP